MKDFSECFYDELIDFCNELCNDCVDFIELKDKISDVQIKSKQKAKISKFNIAVTCFRLSKNNAFSKGKI